jgi:hypothetical protein
MAAAAFKKYMDQMRDMEGALVERGSLYHPDNLLTTPSPSVNWMFGKRGYGMPYGHAALFWGMPKGGKSLLFRCMVGEMHRRHKDYIAINFDTEFRDDGQMTEEDAASYGIDLNRYMTFQVNEPDQIFDRIRGPIAEMIEDGAKVKLIGIDSVNGVLGRRTAGNDSINDVTIGDHAQTLQLGLQSIIKLQHTKRFALVLTAQERAEMDMWEAKRSKTKAAVSFATRHHCEYFVNIEEDKTQGSRKDADDEALEDTSKKGMDGDAERTGHHVKVWMQNNSVGPKNRMGIFTVDYSRGLINQHEEVFELGKNWGVIKKLTNTTWQIGEKQLSGGAPGVRRALASDTQLQAYVMAQLFAMEKRPPKGANQLTQEEAAAAFGEATTAYGEVSA